MILRQIREQYCAKLGNNRPIEHQRVWNGSYVPALSAPYGLPIASVLRIGITMTLPSLTLVCRQDNSSWWSVGGSDSQANAEHVEMKGGEHAIFFHPTKNPINPIKNMPLSTMLYFVYVEAKNI